MLLALGLKPSAPVDVRQYADPLTRARLRSESALRVLSFWDPEHRRPTVDLFADDPKDFDALYGGSEHDNLKPEWGSWESAEQMRQWSFQQRTPQQRLDWLVQALEIAYRSGALRVEPKQS